MARFVASFYRCHTPGVSDLIIRNGEKDTSDYTMFDDLGPEVIRFVGPDDGFNTWDSTAGYAPAQQDIYERYPGYDAYLCIEDDTVLETPGFDTWLLAEFDKFPNRVGMIELYDRSQTIHCQCFSKEWLKTIGYLCIPAVGEHAFGVSLALAGRAFFRLGVGAQFTHYPCVRSYGYAGNERAGAMENGNEPVRQWYYEQWEQIFHDWIPQHADALRARLEKEARPWP
jgi:hypothetical protein